MIELLDVSKSYGPRRALERLRLSVGPGEIVALVGANGAGKSTTLGIATGQVIADEGQVRLGGHDLSREPLAARHALGALSQESPLPRHLTARELTAFIAEVRGKAVDEEILRLALDPEDWDRLIGELSSGTQRKVACATALIGEPPALVLDEPFVGFDVGAVSRFEEILRARTAAGAAVLFSNHDLDSVARLATRCLLLERGRVAQSLAGKEITPRALSAWIARTPETPEQSGERRTPLES